MDTTPLYHAIKGRHIDAVELLLINGADLNKPSRYNITPLCQAYDTDIDITDLLIRYGAYPHNYIIQRMFNNEEIGLIRTLIECNIDMSSIYPVHEAISNDLGMDTVRLLLDAGYDPNHMHHMHHALYIPIHSARNINYIELLVSYGADINLKGNRRSILYKWAREEDAIAINRLLQVPNIDVNSINGDMDETPLIGVIRINRPHIAHILLDHGADPHITTKEMISPLHYAVKSNDISIVKRLLELGVSPNICDDKGNQPLHYATNIDVIQTLIDTGNIDVNAKNKEGRTPIYHAHDIDCAELLVHHGAALNVTDNHGVAPYGYVQLYKSDIKLSTYMMFNTTSHRYNAPC